MGDIKDYSKGAHCQFRSHRLSKTSRDDQSGNEGTYEDWVTGQGEFLQQRGERNREGRIAMFSAYHSCSGSTAGIRSKAQGQGSSYTDQLKGPNAEAPFRRTEESKVMDVTPKKKQGRKWQY